MPSLTIAKTPRSSPQRDVFVSRFAVRKLFEGKRVALVGSGPGVLDNEEGFVDSHDVVVRVNNYKLSPTAGFRADCHYSFYGHSIRKSAADLINDGVTLCYCKCPNTAAIESEWHMQRNKQHGVDFRWIYVEREKWWPCATYIPSKEAFLAKFVLLDRHIPTTGFSAILDILAHKPASLYLTGFDFFASKLHNIDEPWREKNPDDPIRHVPDRERAWLADNLPHLNVTCDRRLMDALAGAAEVAA